MSLTNFPLMTLYDAVDYVLDQVNGGDASPRTRRLAWQAVREAYREIPMRRQWTYYYRPFTIVAVAPTHSGGITYDFTGGSSERLVTFDTITLPTDVVKYALYVAGKRYTIDTRIDNSNLTLSERDCPTVDLAAGTAYTLLRDSYELPDTCRAVFTVYDTTAPGRLISVSPDRIMQEQRIVRTSATPSMYSVFRSDPFASGESIHFAPSNSTAITYQAYGLFWPQPLKTLEYVNGTVATTANSATVTGTNTAFSSDHVGAVIRFSATGDTAIPTDLQGEIDKDRFSPYTMQRVVKSVSSTTSLVLEQSADTTLSGSGFRISSRIDIEPGAMQNAFLKCCEARFAAQDKVGAAEREKRYEKALELAMNADQRIFETVGPDYWVKNLADVAAAVSITT